MSKKGIKTLRTALIIFFSALFCVCLFVLIRILTDYKNSEDIYENAREEFTSSAPPVETPAPAVSPGSQATPNPSEPAGSDLTPPPIIVDFEALRAVSPDTVGWIYIEGTNINYPLVQGEDNEKYLNTTYDGRENIAGSIFVDCYQKGDFTEKNTIIYGHNMKNGSMFADLINYHNQGFYEEHKYVYVITESGILTYEVFSAYKTDSSGGAYTRKFDSSEDFRQFLNDAARNSWLVTNVEPTADDKVITLSTCTVQADDERFVVHARLIEDTRKEEP